MCPSKRRTDPVGRSPPLAGILCRNPKPPIQDEPFPGPDRDRRPSNELVGAHTGRACLLRSEPHVERSIRSMREWIQRHKRTHARPYDKSERIRMHPYLEV